MADDKEKAEAVRDFVNMMIGALETGFVDSNSPTLATVHQVYRNHVKENYGVDMPDIVEDWGQAVAELAGLHAEERAHRSEAVKAGMISPDDLAN